MNLPNFDWLSVGAYLVVFVVGLLIDPNSLWNRLRGGGGASPQLDLSGILQALKAALEQAAAKKAQEEEQHQLLAQLHETLNGKK